MSSLNPEDVDAIPLSVLAYVGDAVRAIYERAFLRVGVAESIGTLIWTSFIRRLSCVFVLQLKPRPSLTWSHFSRLKRQMWQDVPVTSGWDAGQGVCRFSITGIPPGLKRS